MQLLLHGWSYRHGRSGYPEIAFIPVDILRRGLQTNQNHFLASCMPMLSASSAVNTILPQAAPGDAPSAFATGVAAFSAAASNCRMKKCIQVTRIDHGHCLLPVFSYLHLPDRRQSSGLLLLFSCRYVSAACTAFRASTVNSISCISR